MHYYDFINEVSRGWIIRPFCSCISHDWKSPSPLKLKSSERNLISNFVCVWGKMSLARRHIPYISFNCFAFLYVYWLLYSSSVGLMDCILIASEFRPRMFVISPHHTTLSAFHWTTHKIYKKNKTESSLSPIRTKATRILLYFFWLVFEYIHWMLVDSCLGKMWQNISERFGKRKSVSCPKSNSLFHSIHHWFFHVNAYFVARAKNRTKLTSENT